MHHNSVGLGFVHLSLLQVVNAVGLKSSMLDTVDPLVRMEVSHSIVRLVMGHL